MLIVEQQVSVASAKAIIKRIEEGFTILDPESVMANSIDQLKSYGLSTPKARYIHGVAEAVAKGKVDLNELRHLDDEAACEMLIALKGIGRWTAEAYLMGCEGRTDLFPAGDIALQEAIRILDGAASRPSIKDFYRRSEQWRPYRSLAANLLWRFYSGIKTNTIPMPHGVPPLVKSSKTASVRKLAN
jgi:DNA-3-methyladenine glycosylase II